MFRLATVALATLALAGCAPANDPAPVQAVTMNAVEISVPAHTMDRCSEEDASGPVGAPCVFFTEDGAGVVYVGDGSEWARITNDEARTLAKFAPFN